MTKIAVLAHDNGEMTVYCGYFDSPDRLRAAVEKLCAERLDSDNDEPPDVEVRIETVEVVPKHIGDTFLDHLADLLGDAGCEIERTSEVKERREREAAEREAPAPAEPCPGQIALEGWSHDG